MTKKTLEKLAAESPQAKAFLENRSAVLRQTNRKDEVHGEIRGYLAALRTLGIIEDTEMRELLVFYTL